MENIQQIPHLPLSEVSCSGEPDLKNPGQGKLAWHSGVQKVTGQPRGGDVQRFLASHCGHLYLFTTCGLSLGRPQ